MLVPKLRFKEFNYEWVSIVLKDIFNIFAGGDIEKEHCKSEKVPPFIFPIYANAIDKNGLYGYSDLYKVEGATLTVAGRGVNTGHAIARFEKYYPIVRLLILIPKIESNMYFYENLINTCKLFIESTGIPQLTVPQISSYKFLVPNKNEQDKIGKLFELLDKKIELQQRKINALKMYKKGLTRRIFNKLNKEKACRLGDVCDITKGKQLNKEDMLSQGQYYVLNGGMEPSGYIDRYNVNENVITISEGGNSCGYVKYNSEKFWSGGHCYSLQSIKNNVNNRYLYQLLKNFEEEIMALRVGSGLPNIQKTSLENYEIYMHNFNEQLKLSDFLDKLDFKIMASEKYFSSLNLLKKGFLQQMFI